MGRAGAPPGGATLLAAGSPAPPPIGCRPAADLHTFRPLSRQPRIETCTALLKGPRAAWTGRAARGGREGNATHRPPRPPSLSPYPGATVLGGTTEPGRASSYTLCRALPFFCSESGRAIEAQGGSRPREHTHRSAKTLCLQDSVQPPLSPREEGWELAASMQDCLHPAEYPDSCRSSSSPSPAQPECCHAACRPCGTGVSALTPSPRSRLLFSGYSLLWSNVAAETNTPPWLPPSRAPPVSTHAIYSSHRALGLTCFPSHALAALPRGPVLATPGAGGPRRAAPLYHMW